MKRTSVRAGNFRVQIYAKLAQISIATDLKEMTVPFKLKDVAVPAEK